MENSSAGTPASLASKASCPRRSMRRTRRETGAVAQVEMPQPPGVRCRRVDRSGGVQAPSWGAPARLLHRRRQAHLRGPRRHRHAGQGACRSAPPTGPFDANEFATQRAAAPQDPLRIAAGSLTCPLGRAATRRRDHLSDLDRRRTAAPHSLRRTPLRQARARGPAGSSARRLNRARLSRNSATTPRLDRSLPSAGPKSDRLFRERSLSFACLRRSGASRASSGGVCGAQPHAHQRILLQPGIRHLTCSLRWPALWLKLDVAQDVPRILQCIMNGQRCRSFRGEVAPGPVAQAIVAVLPRRPAKRRRSRSRHVKAYVAVHNGRRCTTNSQPGMIR